jgi:alpha-beta hydrolase superfamily lysophospholipase
METRPPVPALKHIFGEARILGDWVRGRFAEQRLARALPGDGRPVIVVPGLFTSDRRTAKLRRTLKAAGYRTYGWGMGRNMPIKADILDRFGERVDAVLRREGAPVTLIGWSMGGLIARAYAHHAPHRVAEVITLGSPFSGDPRANRAWPLYELIADHKVDAPPLLFERAAKPPVRTTAIWSARDGVIAAESAKGEPDERDQAIEIHCGHFAMATAPEALEAVLKVLAAPRIL